MWVPHDVAEIEDAARSGRLEETPSFDAKRELPSTPKKNSDVAEDVARMSTDGGVLLYGIAEDEHDRPTFPQPIPLAGAADRIGQIVATSISEVPYIDVREYPCADDPSKGYLLVIVPQSARAPHQVTVGGDLRYYGRAAKGNRRLTEGEVARLYLQRQEWTKSLTALLEECIAAAPLPPVEDTGYLHVFAQPVVPDQSILGRAFAALGDRSRVQQALLQRAAEVRVGNGFSPTLREGHYWERRGADEWRLTNRSDADRQGKRGAMSLIEFCVNIDGRARLFSSRGTDFAVGQPERPYILEAVVAGEVAEFFAVSGMLYEAASYFGALNVGVALTNIAGAQSYMRSQNYMGDDFAYSAPTFTRTRPLTSARELAGDGYQAVTRDLLGHLLDALTGRDGFDPFSS